MIFLSYLTFRAVIISSTSIEGKRYISSSIRREDDIDRTGIKMAMTIIVFLDLTLINNENGKRRYNTINIQTNI